MNIIDQPESRKLHRAPVPLLGGVAIYAAFIAAILVFGEALNLPQLFGILIGATAVSALGVWDDRRKIRPLVKLGGQAAAALFVVATGTQVALFDNPADYAISVFWIVIITNALNLLDNMDGLSGGVAAVASGFFLLLALLQGQYLVATLSAALLGACLGFLWYNFNPASIFMGDAGSLFLGFVLAAVGIRLRFPGQLTAISWMIPVFVLGVPLFDTLLVVVSRLRRGLNPLTTPGRDHLSHRLVAIGLSQRRAVVTIYLMCVVLGVLGGVLVYSKLEIAYAIAGIASLAALSALVALERVNYGGLASASTP
ncbi:MAG: MraY family glycosyltransferase [Dehalococcoidia bacterium]|nr:MraY family glycosyltransferase [Dehalococcoidia bacterium]